MSVAPWLWWVSCWWRGGSRRRGIRRGRAGRYCCEDKWHEDWLRSLVLIELLHRPRKSWNVRPCHSGFSIARWLLALSRVEKSTEKVEGCDFFGGALELLRAPLFFMGFAGPAYQSGVLPSATTMKFKRRKVGTVLLGKSRAPHKLEDVVPQVACPLQS